MINRSLHRQERRSNHLSIIVVRRSRAHWHYYAAFIDSRGGYRLSNTFVLQCAGATSCHYTVSWYTGWRLRTLTTVYAITIIYLSRHVRSYLAALRRIAPRRAVHSRRRRKRGVIVSYFLLCVMRDRARAPLTSYSDDDPLPIIRRSEYIGIIID